jgi:hypothetical protein
MVYDFPPVNRQEMLPRMRTILAIFLYLQLDFPLELPFDRTVILFIIKRDRVLTLLRFFYKIVRYQENTTRIFLMNASF